MADYSYIGSGKIRIKEYGVAAGFDDLGNCSGLNLGVTEDVKESKDHTTPGGGTFNEVRRISAVEAQITQAELKPEGIMRALYGAASAQTEAAVADEVHVAYLDKFVPFDKIEKTGAAVTVTNSAGTTTYVEGEDYTVEPGGIVPLSTGDITEGQSIKVNYTRAKADLVNALVNAGKEWTIQFSGLNEARSGKKTRVTLHRVRLGAAQQVSLIGDDYAVLEQSGKLLKDPTKSGAGISPYALIEVEA